MTIICGLHQNGETWIGSDTHSIGQTGKYKGRPKWVLHEEWAVGYSGFLRAGNLIRGYADTLFHNLESPFDFTQRLRPVLVDNGFLSDSDPGPPSYGCSFVLANKQGVWDVCTGLSVEATEEICCRGSGAMFARGAAYGLGASDTESLVRMAVNAALAFDENCGGEVWIAKL